MNALLPIVYKDDHIVVINKPNGLLVHASAIARDADENALILLRDQIGQYLYPVHRLDRKTSGLLLFALSQEAAVAMKALFTDHHITKTYHAIVRGHFMHEDILLDYALTNDRGKIQQAVTRFRLLRKSEIPVPFGKHDTSRYSLVEAVPRTGRMHQIRKHLAHMMHPVIGDRPHGCNKQNRLFKEKWNMNTMLLHASALDFKHPVTGQQMALKGEFQDEYKRMLRELALDVCR